MTFEETTDVAPILLFVFARPEHTKRAVEALKKNELAIKSDLYIFADAPRYELQAGPVGKVRQYIRQIGGFKSVSIVERETNFGLAKSIIEGVTCIVNKHGRVIVLEDDLITSPHFLTYMNQALEKYAHDERVASIHGYVYPVIKPLPEAFFLRGADCWGWATWRRAWADFNPDGKYLLDELRRQKLLHDFDFDGTYPFSKMLEDQIICKNDSWAIRWYASAFLADKLTLYPGRSFVHNIGNDASGTHTSETAQYATSLRESPIDLNNLVVEPSHEGRQAFAEFFRIPYRPSRQRLFDKQFFVNAMKSFKIFIKGWIPPRMLKWASRMLYGVGRGQAIRFEGDFKSWEEANINCTGYDSSSILEKVLEATLMVKRGEFAFERDSVLFSQIKYDWSILAGLMWVAARSGGRLNVLDFGGALGSTYFQNRKFLDTLTEVRWNIIEQENYVNAGRSKIQNGQLHFYSNIEECLSENQPNIILLSSVLQYLKSPNEIIHKLSDTGAALLIINRTSFSNHLADKIIVQRIFPPIYAASYPMWVFSEREFLNLLAPNWHLIDSSLSTEGIVHSTEGFEFCFKNLLLEVRR
jgi:putative methyltransferase (TIGR04325 family)